MSGQTTEEMLTEHVENIAKSIELQGYILSRARGFHCMDTEDQAYLLTDIREAFYFDDDEIVSFTESSDSDALWDACMERVSEGVYDIQRRPDWVSIGWEDNNPDYEYRILVAGGGPNIWIYTEGGSVATIQGYWGRDEVMRCMLGDGVAYWLSAIGISD